MKKFKVVAIAMLALFLFSSCAGIHSLSGISVAPNVELSQNNFHVVKHVSSSAKCTYVFGIGGLSWKALKQNAIADMINKANLTGSQTVINVTTKISRRMITPIFIQTTITANGTVIEFDNPSFGYTVSLTEVGKDDATNNTDYGPSATSPLGLCKSGDIKDMSSREQQMIFEMLVDELTNDMRNAMSMDELRIVQENVELVKTYSGLMNKSTRKDIDKLDKSLNNKINRFSKDRNTLVQSTGQPVIEENMEVEGESVSDDVESDKKVEVAETDSSLDTPLYYCESGKIREMETKEQRAILRALINDDLYNDVRAAKTYEELQQVKANVELVKNYSDLMTSGMQEDIDELANSVERKLSRLEKKGAR